MTSPLQALFFMAITLAPPGTHHVVVSGGAQVYSWDRGDKSDDASTWTYDGAIDPLNPLVTNDVAPRNMSEAQREIVKSTHRDANSEFVLRFDSAHELQKTSLGYVYVVRPGSPNQKFYSFSFE